MTASYIIDAVRTPRGRGKMGKGALTGLHPQELLAQTLNALQRRGGWDAREVGDVIAGCVSQVNEQGANIARNAVLAAGWPQDVSAVSLNRFCGSGLQAVNFGAMGVASGAMDFVVAGGVESMSHLSLGADGGGQDGGNVRLRERVYQVPQGISADLIATLEGITREDVDAWALRSQRQAARAIEENRFAKALFAVKDPATGAVLLERDEYPRPDTTAQGLAALKPAFVAMGETAVGPDGETLDGIALAAYPQAKRIQHVHTAGNSSGIVDGAAVVALASERYVKQKGLKPRARIRAMATLGTEPLIMLTAPAPVSEKALRMAGMKAGDIDLWEINEAFAGVVLQTTRALGIDPDRVNVNGGAIALGHPLGATGAMLLGTALDELERTGKGTALITMCIGGGQGIATVIERV
ncbi:MULTISPECIES: acetyl-CoA C-acetyltransferase [unclassified Corallococcus]|uniref:acetyl-CoA C-acetyltransferase n=1 Tax=unclassified Corallococcus TaxID=2685029 RepID=UPI001A8CAD30|nr:MULTISPECIES: acetyl-CoA C-acetyltransferase [unclassified Corallococcus]MBN9687522.1 acetyl-CoA C-acetyltransferase [Corallococcus sp. NCSPR001]WAS88656.1 acetyl-CoA C-acetyltransferase [Corallococcus sp. NCRR]